MFELDYKIKSIETRTWYSE